MQPDSLYRPEPEQPQPVAEPVQPVPVVATVQPSPQPVVQAPVEPVQADIPQSADEQDIADEAPVTWVAHEYLHQEKGTTWFIMFGVVIAAMIAVSIFLMQSISFTILLAVIAVLIVVYSRRPPRELTYSLTDEGLTIDNRLHAFSNFKSFGVIRDGAEYSIMLIPMQRFQPSVTVYFPEEYGEDIVDMLGSQLPMKDLKLDMVDRVVRMLRL